MGKIKILSDDLINKIAAGEVIERPYSVVKELVENSIDAGAKTITVKIVMGGINEITVIDDGEGMDKDDAVMSIGKHATSKLRTADDLERIKSMGFRGEALASIASVSRFMLVTRREENPRGTEARFESGDMKVNEDAVCDKGTTVTVKNLFFNIPARRKFLKSPDTEFSHILKYVEQLSLVNQGYEFYLFHNGKSALKTEKGATIQERLTVAFGEDIGDKMIEVEDVSLPGVGVRGYVSPPHLTRKTKNSQYFFVNKRLIRNQILSHAVAEAYRNVIPGDRFPLVCIFMEIDPKLVDVNVHPTKREVRFSNQTDIHDLVFSAVKSRLQTITPQAEGITPDMADALGKSSPLEKRYPSGKRLYEIPSKTETFKIFEKREKYTTGQPAVSKSMKKTWDETEKEIKESNEDSDEIIPLCQVFNTYIICRTKDGMAIIDQHACHERIVFDMIMEKQEGERVNSQLFLIPIRIKLTKAEAKILKGIAEQLNDMGFDIENFGDTEYVIRGAPVILGRKVCGKEQLLDIIEEFSETYFSGKAKIDKDRIVKSVACHASIRAGEHLEQEEMRELIKLLSNTANKHTCPDGRPIMITLSRADMEKMFGRR